MIERLRDFITRIAPKIVCRDCGTILKECRIEGLYCERCLRHGRPERAAPDLPGPTKLFRKRLCLIVLILCFLVIFAGVYLNI